MKIYNKFAKTGTENLKIVAKIEGKVREANLGENELRRMIRGFLAQSYPDKKIEILEISTEE